MRFKTNTDLFQRKQITEYFEKSWMEGDPYKLVLPPQVLWSNKRLPKIEEIDIWEVISEQSGLSGLYAPWCPYIDLFLVISNGNVIDFTTEEKAEQLCKNYKINYPYRKIQPSFNSKELLIARQ